MSDSIRNFDDVPVGARFADKFGRVFTKTAAGSARAHEHSAVDDPEVAWPIIDQSREYFEYTEEDFEEDPMVFDTWPYYVLEASE